MTRLGVSTPAEELGAMAETAADCETGAAGAPFKAPLMWGSLETGSLGRALLSELSPGFGLPDSAESEPPSTGVEREKSSSPLKTPRPSG
jgi:hypothetical protein